MKKEICHVCGKIKKPYSVFLDDNILSLINYGMAREDGLICKRCDRYFSMTGKLKDASEEEFKRAERIIKNGEKEQ